MAGLIWGLQIRTLPGSGVLLREGIGRGPDGFAQPGKQSCVREWLARPLGLPRTLDRLGGRGKPSTPPEGLLGAILEGSRGMLVRGKGGDLGDPQSEAQGMGA